MAVNYVTQKCTSCAGTKLEYIKELNAWRCSYCGTLIERHEQVDTMFTIKNVVRQALLDVAYTRMDSAQKNLVECEKIDSRYVGTIIAEIAYEMNMIIHGDISQNEQRNMFALLKKNYMALNSISEIPTDEEIALYEFFDSSEIIGLLILVYDSLNATKRRDFIYQYFNASEIYSLELNTDLINYSLKNQNYEVFDKIVNNVDNIDTKSVLSLILNKYPDGEKKRVNAVMLAEIEGSLSEEDKKMSEEYLENSGDCIETKCSIAIALLNTPARPSVECLMKNVITNLTEEKDISQIFDAVMKKQLLDVEIYTILDFAVLECSDNACRYILNKFYETKQFVEFSYKHFNAILLRNSNAEIKKQLIDVGLKFNVSEKTKETFISTYLCDTEDLIENRKILIPYLLSLVEMLSTNSVEKYLFKCSIDKEMKSEVVKMIFEMKINRSFFHNTLSNYVKTSNDPFVVKKEVIYTLISVGLNISTDAILELLYQNSLSVDERIDLLRQLKNNSISTDEITNNYLTNVNVLEFEPNIFAELISVTTTITEKSFVRYVLEIKDLDAAKIGYVSKMSSMCYDNVANIRCSVNHNGRSILCNIIQGYILAAQENEEVAVSILSALRANCGDINTEIDASGSRMKFKKYINMQKNNLDSKTRRLCVESRIL